MTRRQQQAQPEDQTPRDLADRAAELALLGCMVLDTEYTLETCAETHVTADSFYFSDHQRLFSVLMAAWDRGEPADHITVGYDAPELRALATEAQAAVPSFLHAPTYAARVAELAERRRMMAIAEQVAGAAVAGDLDKAGAILATAGAPRTKGRRAARTSYTAADLLSAVFPDPVWLAPGLIPAGMVVLAGRPKLGKSWLALQLAVAVASGGKFLDADITRRPVMYIALEDSPIRLKDRLTLQRATAGADLDFFFEFPALSDDRALLTLERMRAERGYQLVIIDTLSRAIGKVDQNDQAEVGFVVNQLQRWAIEHDICLLLVDHHKKPSATVNDLVSDVMGATSKTAAADAVIGLYRQRGQRDATLKTTGRDIEERELSIEFDRSIGTWILRGDAEQVVNGEQMQAIIDALKVLGQATHREIYETTNQDRSHAFTRLQELVTRGIVRRIDGSPARFALADNAQGRG
jgi:KaiC/GvpD/RAD55 family RecA-like ATPase